MNISATRSPIGIKFYLKHHLGGGKGFCRSVGPELWFSWQKISPIVIMGKTASSRFSNDFDWILFILAGNYDMHESLDEYEIWPNSTTDYGVSCP